MSAALGFELEVDWEAAQEVRKRAYDAVRRKVTGGAVMEKIGRVFTVLGIIGVLFLLSLSIPGLGGYVNDHDPNLLTENTVGALTALGVFGAWFLAIIHWWTRYSGSPSSRRRWGFAITIGLFVGAWAYWLGPASRSEPQSAKSEEYSRSPIESIRSGFLL